MYLFRIDVIQHDDGMYILVPNKVPVVFYGVCQGHLSDSVVVMGPVTLQTLNYIDMYVYHF